MPPGPEMTSEDVTELTDSLESVGIGLWIDGGWAVDALLGRQTRPHEDLDIVIEQKNVPRLRTQLTARGYRDLLRDDTSPWNFVLGDDQGRQVDVHVIVFDGVGNGLYGPAERGEMYPAGSLTGTGSIGRRGVRCVSAKYLLQSRCGYEPREKDFKDVVALCENFDLNFPE